LYQIKSDTPLIVNFWFSKETEDGALTVLTRGNKDQLVKTYIFEDEPKMPISSSKAKHHGTHKVEIPKGSIKKWKTYYAVITAESDVHATLLLEQHKTTQ
jgi:hypothetical protein